MGFKLKSCDESDYEQWIADPVTASFIAHMTEAMQTGISRLIRDPSEINAGAVRNLEKLLHDIKTPEERE